MRKTIIERALKVMEDDFRHGLNKMDSSKQIKDFLRLQIGSAKEEIFAVMFFDHHYKLLGFDKMFFGTIAETTVHARPILRKVFEYNAAKIVISHNHPSASLTPSKADKEMTQWLVKLFRQLDCPIIDHVIVSATGAMSFAEAGLL